MPRKSNPIEILVVIDRNLYEFRRLHADPRRPLGDMFGAQSRGCLADPEHGREVVVVGHDVVAFGLGL